MLSALADILPSTVGAAGGATQPTIDPYGLALVMRIFSGLFTLAVLVWIGRMIWQDWRRQQWEKLGRCRACGYDLRALLDPSRCPECGTTTHPEDEDPGPAADPGRWDGE